MWTLNNRTRYAAERSWTRDKDGMHWWLIAVRATYDLADSGSMTLAEEQLPPLLAPEYFGAPGKSSLRYDSDLLAVKPTTDVLVLGSAYAPGGQPASVVPVTLRVGHLQKELLVHGERLYRAGTASLKTSSARPFRVQPLRYELAFGGLDTSDPDPRRHRYDARNPVGRGTALDPLALVDTPAHTIEYADGEPASRGPAGFGPIAPSWSPRLELAGTYDQAWEKSRKPLLPADYNPAFAQSSPVDQRAPQPLAGGERMELLNMTPGGRLLFELPSHSFGLTSAFGTRRESHHAILATVLVEPDERRLSLVWQSALRVPAPQADYLDSTEIVERGQGR